MGMTMKTQIWVNPDTQVFLNMAALVGIVSGRDLSIHTRREKLAQ